MTEKKDHLAGLAIQIPQSFIEDTIRAEIVRAMPNKDAIVETVVRKALEEKDRNTYGNETLFQTTVAAAIRDEAKKIMLDWIAQHREQIRDALVKELNRTRGKRITDLATKLADGLATAGIASIHLDIYENKDGSR